MKLARILLLALVAGGSVKDVGRMKVMAGEMPEDSAMGDTSFALRLYAKLGQSPGNLFFSPFSISTCLSLACEGARGNTEKQMLRVLGPRTNHKADFQSIFADRRFGRGQCELDIANGLWCQSDYHFLPTFLEMATRRYDAELRQVDFKTQPELATGEINRWVAEKTRGKIQNILPPGSLNESNRMVIANAIYFKGTWTTKFDSNLTTLQPFSVSLTKKLDVQLMSHLDVVPYVGNETFQAVELPYSAGSLSMLIFLPRNVEGLSQLEGWLNPVFLSRWLGRMKPQKVEICVPRFKLESSFELKRQLVEMGMPDAFSLDSANFSGMDGTGALYISSVFHKAWVVVAEEGTEAAAATAVGVWYLGVNPKPPAPPLIFRADHPFVFLIHEKGSGRILFLGRVNDPTT